MPENSFRHHSSGLSRRQLVGSVNSICSVTASILLDQEVSSRSTCRVLCSCRHEDRFLQHADGAEQSEIRLEYAAWAQRSLFVPALEVELFEAATREVLFFAIAPVCKFPHLWQLCLVPCHEFRKRFSSARIGEGKQQWHRRTSASVSAKRSWPSLGLPWHLAASAAMAVMISSVMPPCRMIADSEASSPSRDTEDPKPPEFPKRRRALSSGAQEFESFGQQELERLKDDPRRHALPEDVKEKLKGMKDEAPGKPGFPSFDE